MRTSTIAPFKIFMIGAALSFFSIAPALCQDAPSDQVGPTPNATHHGSDIDLVNVGSRRLNLHIPLLVDHSQRGDLNFTYSFSYTSTGGWSIYQFRTNYPFQWKPPKHGFGGLQFTMDGYLSPGGLSYKDPDTGKIAREPLVYEGPALFGGGTPHPLGLITGNFSNGTIYPPYIMESIDGSGIQVSSDSTGNATTTNKQGVGFHSTYVEDVNGNTMTYYQSSASPSPTWTDTLGRTWTTTTSTDFSGCPVAAASASTWTTPGPNGGVRIFKFCYSTVNINTNFAYPNYSIQEYNSTMSALTGIVLPNLKTWRFDYNNYGDIQKIYLPTGGTISYTWATTFNGCATPEDALRIVSSRTVFDGTNSYTWNYNGSIVTDPLSNDTMYNATCAGIVTSIKSYSGSVAGGNLLKTVSNTYQTLDDPYINDLQEASANAPVLHLSTATTWPNGQLNQEQYVYDSGFTFKDANNGSTHQSFYGLVTSDVHSDYGNGSPGPALATINKNYLALSNSTYLNANLLELKSAVVTLNTSGYKCAETDYGYDDPARLVSSGVTQHHGTAPSTVRGNLTSVTRQLSGTPCQASATWTPISSYNNVYDTGMLYQSIDPLLHTTTYAYSPTYDGAYPTTVTNALNHSTTHVYDFNTGLPSSTTDPNSLTTSFSYDNMLRLTQANHPDGGQEINTYQESAYPFTATVSTPINPSQNKITVSVFDGLGHSTQSQLTSDSQGTVYTDTTYDALGRVHSVSNPYRQGSDITTTTGNTTYGYDALGRKTSETYSDNSVLTTAYCGSSTLVTDPTGRWRRSRADGLGRLVEVDEPNAPGASVNSNGCPGTGEPTWVTSYTYDTLGNLTQAVQNGSHTRTFTYDSLSRLLASSNPEAGTITYKYDSDMNCAAPNSFATLLVSKTDARGIRTCAQYDALNRETVLNYSNGDPTVTTTYDQSACLGLSACQNIGHRTSMTDAAGSEAWSFQVDATNHRSVHVDQRTTNSSPSNITKTSTYYLDLAGNVNQAAYPTGRVVNYTYDSADRPSTATDASNGITYATGFKTSPGGTCLNNATCYTPQGTFYALSIGQSSTFSGLNLTHSYNSRLQPSEFKASSTGGNAIDISYNFVDPVSGKNAGHVYGITNNLDSTRSQTFSYDQLNRITAAQTTSTFATSPSHCWGETYSLDPWGNLQSLAGGSSQYTGCTYETGFTKTADGNNHLSGFSYDSSGNTTADGFNSYTWDAESQLKVTAGSTYLYDGDGRRVAKANTQTPPVPYKLYWYGAGGEVLSETDASGNTSAEYVFFGGKRVAMLPGNAVSNGGFEQGLSGWSTWGAGITAQLITTPSSCHSGNNCLQLSVATAGQSGETDSQQIPVSIGQVVTMGGWVYQQSGPNGGAFWQMGVYAQNGTQYVVPSTNSVLGTWVYQSATYTVPSYMACPCYVLIYAQLDTGSQQNVARFDDGFVSVPPSYYVEDLLGTSRVITTNTGAVCYDADFYPFGGERTPYTNTCPQNYKFEGKERDTETGNDDFGARYYSNRFGRWLSADWSSVPVAVPYANLTNPQTLNLYAMVGDDPESFADLDGHACPPCIEEVIKIAVEHPEATEKVIKVTVSVVEDIGEAVEDVGEAASFAGKTAFGAAIFLALQMEGDNAPPKKQDNAPKNPPTNAPTQPNTGPTPQPTSPASPPAVDSSRRRTRDKHQKPHPSRTGDKLRKRKDWVPKKKSGGGPSKPEPPKPPQQPPPPPPPPPPQSDRRSP